MHRLLYISEQHRRQPLDNLSDYLKGVLEKETYQKTFFHKPELLCYQLYNEAPGFSIDTQYFVGVDWLETGKAAVYVEPKLNKARQVNFLGMLQQSLEAPENFEHLDNLFHVDFDEPWITIPEQKDILSPILIVQFLKLVQTIVRKGLKKSYYRVTENLNSRIKGKVLVTQQIKTNIVKNKLTHTVCNYQEFGINSPENQFLKLVLQFVSSYISQQRNFFSASQSVQLNNILHYCLPFFEQVTVLQEERQRISKELNPFYKEYTTAIKTGEYILKRFSFNINKAGQSQTTTPPFWIDMSKLFELYVFGKLKKLFPQPGHITYHDTFRGGKETDILIKAAGYKCVVDCKYKPRYANQSPSLEDKRQLAGYTRMKSVYHKLSVPTDQLISGLIIYSDQDHSETISKEELFQTEISEYISFYKLGIKLPEL